MIVRKFDVEEARAIVGEDHEDWEPITDPEMYDQRRWVTCYSAVFREASTGKYYEFCWEQGSTENQEMGLYEFETEVEAVEVVLTIVKTEKWVAK